MLQVHQTFTVPSDYILRVNVPDVANGEEVEVFIYTKNDSLSREEKLAMLKQAATDPLYLSDMQEIDEDFAAV